MDTFSFMNKRCTKFTDNPISFYTAVAPHIGIQRTLFHNTCMLAPEKTRSLPASVLTCSISIKNARAGDARSRSHVHRSYCTFIFTFRNENYDEFYVSVSFRNIWPIAGPVANDVFITVIVKLFIANK